MAREAWWIAGLAVCAALRAFLFASAFPFWNPIDEHLHFDLVHKYARGFLPDAEEARFDAASARLIADFASPEYLMAPEDHPVGRPPTPAEFHALRPPGSIAEHVALGRLIERVNIEADAPPTYYALAGAWLRLGRALGLEGLALLYWVRWLAVGFVAAAVVGTWAALRAHGVEPRFVRIAAPALVAVWPNDLLYGITPDALALPLGALAFAALLRLRAGGASLGLHAGAGLLFGLAFLNKYPAVVYAGLAAGFAGIAVARAVRAGTGRDAVLRWGATGFAAALPAGWWLARNLIFLGSVSGQHRKLVWLGWSTHGPAEALAHPLVGASGWPDFALTFLRSFWRGEFVWQGQVQHLAWVDGVYVAASLVLLGSAALAFRGLGPAERRVDATAWAILAASVAVLAVLSTLFDYGVEEGPLSRAHPYLASGRLVAGAWPVFALLCARGLAAAWALAPPRAGAIGRWTSLAALAALALGSEAWTSATAFTSPWNWFHHP